MTIHDNVIIGGGPAGCAAAIRLAQAGKDVLLLEREERPHDKICGEFLSGEAVAYLRSLEIDLPDLGTQRITATRLFSGNHAIQFDLPFRAFSLSRKILDEALLQKAMQAGVSVKRGVRVTGLSQAAGPWMLKTAQDNHISANTIFLACGKHDLKGFSRQGGWGRDIIGFKMHMRLPPEQATLLRHHVELTLFPGGYAGLEPIEGGKVNLCLLIRKDVYARCGRNWTGLLAHLREISTLEERLNGAVSLWSHPLAVAGIPYGYLHKPESSLPGFYRLGDQMAVIPSFAGEGISMALHSGFLAADAHLSGGGPAAYNRQAFSDFSGPLHKARLIDGLRFVSGGRQAMFFLSRAWPGFWRVAASAMRVSQPDIGRGEWCGRKDSNFHGG